MKYNVGDKVRVRKGLNLVDRYGVTYAVNDMVKMAGEIVTISKVVDERKFYHIEEDS